MKPGTLRFTSLEGIPISQYMMIIEKWPEEAQGGNWLLGTEWETAIMMEVTRCMNLSLLRLPYRKAGFHGYFGSPEYAHFNNIKGNWQRFHAWVKRQIPKASVRENRNGFARRRQGIVAGTGRVSEISGRRVEYEYEQVHPYAEALQNFQQSTVGTGDPISEATLKEKFIDGLCPPLMTYMSSQPWQDLSYEECVEKAADFWYRHSELYPSQNEIDQYLQGGALVMSVGTQEGAASNNALFGVSLDTPRPFPTNTNTNTDTNPILQALQVGQQQVVEMTGDMERAIASFQQTAASLVSAVQGIGQTRRRESPVVATEDGNQACSRCGSGEHTARRCPRNLQCEKCGKNGHSEAMCWGKCSHCGKWGHKSELCFRLPGNAHLIPSKRGRNGGEEQQGGAGSA